MNRLLIESLKILKDLEISYDDIDWYDFKFNGSKDNELLGENIFQGIFEFNKSISILNKTSWDCVAMLYDCLILGEAKGHLSEFHNNDQSLAKDQSLEEYREIIIEIFKTYKIDESYMPYWTQGGFQLGNRIATQYFLETNGVKNLILYIFFLNDWK